MKKVYCKDCRYHYQCMTGGINWCGSPSNKKIMEYDTPLEHKIIEFKYDECLEKNKNNDCKDFEAK